MRISLILWKIVFLYINFTLRNIETINFCDITVVYLLKFHYKGSEKYSKVYYNPYKYRKQSGVG